MSVSCAFTASMASRSALTAALNSAESPVADFALSGRRLPSAMVEDVNATQELAYGSSIDARSNYLASSVPKAGSGRAGVRETPSGTVRPPGTQPLCAGPVCPHAPRLPVWVCSCCGAMGTRKPAARELQGARAAG